MRIRKAMRQTCNSVLSLSERLRHYRFLVIYDGGVAAQILWLSNWNVNR
jgi:hypothetical protein